MEDSLIILSINRPTSLPKGIIAIKLEVEHRHEKRSTRCLHNLSENDFDKLQLFLLNTTGVCTCDNSLPIIEDFLELQYAISLLREYVLDFTVADILKLYEKNKKLLMPVIHIREMISRLERINRTVEAQDYLALLNRLLEYSPDTVYLDVTMMDSDWFGLFAKHLENSNCSKEEVGRYLYMLKQVYVDICKLSGAKLLYCSEDLVSKSFFNQDFLCSFVERELHDFFNRDFMNSLEEKKLEGLFEKFIGDEYSMAVRNLLFFKYWIPSINFFDLLDLKMEDVHRDGLWYRKRSDNKLCFAKLSSEVVNKIKTKMDRGDNILFPSPFDKIKNEGKRIQLKGDLYMQQIRKFVISYSVVLKEIDL